ncbi:D-alanyl-D-alanine carboxypeptidase [Microbacterium halimionae]|uniref:D-alanyl-D-alanine carboxypeptidase n=1 Tax=Microbacterium halimionae TaxID=1526413 RepID=A0A7W3JLA2_9MICO|nr:M15 family metallopeptidase [Microbacterium halimionae]MBA8814986.1 D-alanyl-D-alanine carboxypeptidase [Microbacterium halimionae]NII94223.1 D-alanyl-D-alanine carboxypeptidase [Microbacterium halimionae]
MASPDVPVSRRARRDARRRSLRRGWLAVGSSVLGLGTIVAIVMALTAPPLSEDTTLVQQSAAASTATSAAPMVVEALPVPQMSTSPSGSGSSGEAASGESDAAVCDDTAVTEALAAGDDGGAIAAVGGAEAFRDAVASGSAPCVSLSDAARVWTVVNKQRAYDPLEYQPTPRKLPDSVRNLAGGSLRSDAAGALTSMVADAADAGVGEIALESGYRSYRTQQSTYGNHVADMGQGEADKVSARPGFSEHQSGLAADVVACGADGCTSLDGLAGTAQGDWVAEHSWEYGFIVRYEDGYTDTTGYSPEPWHLRYIGTDLAAAYHDGNWHTLEDFFALPAAPDYVD